MVSVCSGRRSLRVSAAATVQRRHTSLQTVRVKAPRSRTVTILVAHSTRFDPSTRGCKPAVVVRSDSSRRHTRPCRIRSVQYNAVSTGTFYVRSSFHCPPPPPCTNRLWFNEIHPRVDNCRALVIYPCIVFKYMICCR